MILDGRKLAQSILDRVKIQVAELPFQPVFCDILVGLNPASAQYVKTKGRTAEKVGIKFLNADFPENITTEQLITEIKKLNLTPNICGLIVQLPLPKHLDTEAVLNAIDSKIDVDATGKINTELFYSGKAYLEFPTAAAVMEILDSAGENLQNKNCLVIGYGQLVGKPVSFLLEQRGLKINVARSKTENILELLKEADVIVSATGKPKLITGNKIKPGCIIIDAGTSESEGAVVGDADFNSVKDKAGFISPVPGGVGPVTVAMLLSNVLKVASVK